MNHGVTEAQRPQEFEMRIPFKDALFARSARDHHAMWNARIEAAKASGYEVTIFRDPHTGDHIVIGRLKS